MGARVRHEACGFGGLKALRYMTGDAWLLDIRSPPVVISPYLEGRLPCPNPLAPFRPSGVTP
jgi:hypothetical protein